MSAINHQLSPINHPSLWPDYARRLLVIAASGVLLLTCAWLAYEVRFDFEVRAQYWAEFHQHWGWVVGLQLAFLYGFGQFSGVFRYFSLPDAKRLCYAVALSGLALLLVRWTLGAPYVPPRGVILLDTILAVVLLGGMRVGWRLLSERYDSRVAHASGPRRRVAIIGAGDAGAALIRELHSRPGLGLNPVVLFDDDREKWRLKIHGVPVVGSPELIRSKKRLLDLDEAIIALPSATPKRLGEVVALLQNAGLKYVTIPSLSQIASGRVRLTQLRPVNIVDLLGRQPVDLRTDELQQLLGGQVVVVTGAGGSIGAELCRQIAAYGPSKLLLVDQTEVQLFQIEQELLKMGHVQMVIPVIADILDHPRMSHLLRRFQPAAIFHAAAHKHVFMMERQPAEAIKNNTLGTVGLAELALEHGVKGFIMISTDKAVNPTSVMGASKRLAELFLQACHAENPAGTRFTAVRFGNVLGSSGSVVPIFEKQIAEGGPVTVTDPEVVRFFMTIPEAVGLVLQSYAQGQGGEVFVLDMGEPVKIADLAAQMIRLSGLEPGRDIEIRYTGLRPGEKLFEELAHLTANCADTRHPRIKRLTSSPPPLTELRAALARLTTDIHAASPDELRQRLKHIIPEYTPSSPAKPNP